MSNKIEDERLSQDATLDVVGRRESRDAQERKFTQDRTLTEAERLEMFRNELYNNALPDLPKIPGYHVCWLTTTNTRDPIYRRMQLGYEPIKAEEVPGMEYASIKTGEYAGLVGVNEMVAFKLPESLYQAFMQEAHHNRPLSEEGKIADTADQIAAEANRAGTQLIEEEGMADLRRNLPMNAGKFA